MFTQVFFQTKGDELVKHLFEGYATGENSGSANPLDVGCFETRQSISK